MTVNGSQGRRGWNARKGVQGFQRGTGGRTAPTASPSKPSVGRRVERKYVKRGGEVRVESDPATGRTLTRFNTGGVEHGGENHPARVVADPSGRVVERVWKSMGKTSRLGGPARMTADESGNVGEFFVAGLPFTKENHQRVAEKVRGKERRFGRMSEVVHARVVERAALEVWCTTVISHPTRGDVALFAEAHRTTADGKIVRTDYQYEPPNRALAFPYVHPYAG